jgi:hypothetical protein
MEPPNEQVFETREQLLTCIQQHALSHGYAITTISSNPHRNITLGCDRGGIYHDRIDAPDGAKRRKTSTKRIGCPFRLYGKRLANNRWQIQVRNPTHNHQPDDNMIGHSLARRRQLTGDQNNTINHLSEIGSKPRQIISLLRAEQPTTLIKPSDLYNIRDELRRKKLGNYTPLEFLRETLQNNSWRYTFKQDAEGHILFFMFAHPESIRYANQYNRVFLLGCTYKTNRYKMPLLHIIGLSPSNSSYSIAFCFMQNEQEESYKWTLQTFFSWLDPLPFHPVLCTDRDLALVGAIRSICPKSPHLLCVWHINKNVLTKTKQYFSLNKEFEAFIQSWKELINSTIIVEYKDQLAKFETRFSLTPAALRYVKQTWLTYKEMFIRAWIGQYLHLGNWATSRVEGSHAFLKKYIGASTGDMLFVFERITNAIQAQHYALLSDLTEDQIKTLNICSHFLYSNIRKRTSRYSLRLISEQASIAKRATPEAPLSNCTNIFTRTMGLPCAHRIAPLLMNHQPIPLSDIHQFWRTGLSNEQSEYLPILGPLLLRPPTPRRSNQYDTSYQSNKSSDQRIVKKKAPSKCSNCGEIGHTIRSCKV